MTESTARTERFEAQNAASPLYLWEVAQKPVSVRIPFSLIDRLEKEAVESFRSLTSSGSEIGGLLVGSVAQGNPLVLTISDYDLITCDYSRGPLYRLSDADAGRFEQAIQQRLAAGRGIAGFFRSHTRKGISLDADDLTFFQSRFRDPHHIALLVRPFATKASTAGIFIWENGKVNGEGSYLEFPFRSTELGPGLPPQAAEPKAAAPAPPPVQAPKNAARAQIVPIASRREVPIAPVAEPAAPVAPPPPPAPAAVAAPPAPPVEEKQARFDKPANVPEKQNRVDRPGRYDRPDRTEKTERNDRAAVKPEPPVVKTPPPPARGTKTEVAPPPRFAEPEVSTPEPKSGKGMKLIMAAAVVMIGFVAAFVYPGFMRNNTKAPVVASHQDTSQLQLKAERAAGELLLTWNPDADAVKHAAKAALSITDGDQHENVDMDPSQLASGRIIYSPSGKDIHFEMQITDKAGNKIQSDSVRMVLPPSPLQGGDQARVAPVPAPAATPTKPTATGPTGAPAPAPETVAEAAPAKPSGPTRQFNDSSIANRLRAVPVQTGIDDAPVISATGRASASGIPGLPIGGAAAGPAAPSPAAAAPAASAEKKNATGGQIQQAVLIYRKDAEYPKIAKQTNAKGTVTLNATIGDDGNIKKVKVVHGHPMLVNAAVEAVKQWRYRPTLLNGQPVETETQVLVNFVGQ